MDRDLPNKLLPVELSYDERVRLVAELKAQGKEAKAQALAIVLMEENPQRVLTKGKSISNLSQKGGEK